METSRRRERNRERLACLLASGGPGTKSAPPGHRAHPARGGGDPRVLPGLVVDLGTRSVLLDRLDPVQRGRLALVHFAARDDLTVGGDQVEVVLAVRCLVEHKLARHIASLMRAASDLLGRLLILPSASGFN